MHRWPQIVSRQTFSVDLIGDPARLIFAEQFGPLFCLLL
jgi:hypothetical protein